MKIDKRESALLGKEVEATMDGEHWFKGILVKIIDLFVPYIVRLDNSGEDRGFLRIRRTHAK